MTIALAIKVHDGIVLATDSAASMMSQGADGTVAFHNTYNNANKLFNLVKGQPIGGMVWGAGSIGQASISTLVKDLRKRMTSDPVDVNWHLDKDTYQVEIVAKKVAAFFEEKIALSPGSKPTAGFLVAGYSTVSAASEFWLIQIEDGVVLPPRPPVDPALESTCLAYGQPETVIRLLYGFSPGLMTGLKEKGVPDAELDSYIQAILKHSAAGLIHPAMPIQDTIELAEFLSHATAQFIRFAPGPPTVGGPIDIAAITKHEGFKWVQRKHYYKRKFNPRHDS